MNLSKFRKFSSKGFTLIELLVVIAILGILAATVMISINPAAKITAAKNATVRSDITSIASQANIFNTENSTYPKNFNVPTTFMPVAPKDPSGTPYVITAWDSAGVSTTCTGTSATPCVAFSVYGTAYVDANATPAVVAGYWCWKSKTGAVVNDTTTTNCTTF